MMMISSVYKDGFLINSPLINGLPKDDAIEKILDYFSDNNIGRRSTNYKLARLGYQGNDTGVVLAVIYYEDGTFRVLDKDELPVVHPYDVKLSGKGIRC